jgi:putative ABC transport system permease protein
MTPARIFHVLLNLLRRGAVERALDDELHAALDLLTREKLSAGLPHSEARRRALLELGGLEQVKEECRDARAGAWLDTLVQDLRYSVRVLRRSPGFAVAAALTLALGIGGATAVFSIVNAVVLRPLPYRDPGRLLALVGIDPRMPGMQLGVTPGSYTELRRRARSLSPMAALRPGRKVRIIGQAETTQATGALATADFFELMGVPPVLGRTFGPHDARPGSAPVAVIGYGLWQRVFGGDSRALGRTLILDETAVPIVGVMPASFAQPAECEAWISSDLDSAGSTDFRGGDLTILGRLRPGVSQDQGNSELRALRVAPSGTQTADAVDHELRGHVVEEVARPHRTLLLVLLGAVGLLLAIAVFNVANLQLVQTTGRMREIAVRLALGATRGRVLRQFLLENSVLSLLGGAGGIAASVLGVKSLAAGAARIVPRAAEANIDGTVLAFACAVSLAAGALIGLLTVWRASRAPSGHLKQGAAGFRGAEAKPGRLRFLLTAAQAALSIVLLTAAALLMRSVFVRTSSPPWESGSSLAAASPWATSARSW